ncbi:hypothetical protein OG948_00325 [Embleya sp. NBC_00888]|uniref:hypothetical protein n=1 Tax=Embleya sp. NBC_00888 TaxID=2975960 RepID=UPI00386CC486|nr:hypothetical protein OG948_00325 [Embleya sp. NBC_00888]
MGEQVALVARLVAEKGEFDTWWQHHLRPAIGTPDERAWLRVGEPLDAANRLEPQDIAALTLTDPRIAAAAFAAGATAEPGSAQEERLVRAVLDGHCTDVDLRTRGGFAHDLLRVLAPQHFLHKAIGPDGALYLLPVGHAENWSGGRQGATARLEARDGRFSTLRNAAKFGKGQANTTSPWIDTARAVAAIFGPCWLAAEIAVIGAASSPTEYVTGGGITTGSQPFGPDADYGRLVESLRRAHGFDTGPWWAEQFDRHGDPLSRATWILALLTIAADPVVTANIARLDEAVRAQPADSLRALIASSGRIGASSLSHRLDPATLGAAVGLSTPTLLLLAHHLEPLPDPLAPLTPNDLADMAPYGAAAWPALNALAARTSTGPDDEILDALRAHGPDGRTLLDSHAMTEQAATKIIGSPFDYPLEWVLLAEWTLGGGSARAPGRSRGHTRLVQPLTPRRLLPSVDPSALRVPTRRRRHSRPSAPHRARPVRGAGERRCAGHPRSPGAAGRGLDVVGAGRARGTCRRCPPVAEPPPGIAPRPDHADVSGDHRPFGEPTNARTRSACSCDATRWDARCVRRGGPGVSPSPARRRSGVDCVRRGVPVGLCGWFDTRRGGGGCVCGTAGGARASLLSSRSRLRT